MSVGNVHRQKDRNGVRYSSKPFPDCSDCPKSDACPLVSYQFPCNFKAIYLRQTAEGIAMNPLEEWSNV